jgi:hypothetical protein
MTIKEEMAMLITFKSRATQDLTMMNDLAAVLLGIVGKPLSERGVITAAEMPAAIQKLERAAHEDRSRHEAAPDNAEEADEGQEEPLHLGQRAYPFLDMLRESSRANTDVLWGV